MTRGISFAGTPDDDWRSRAADVIPGGSSTGSKRPDALYGTRALDAAVPTHFERADGCCLWTPDGRRFIDCGMALGAVGIGYADPAITRAVVEAASHGNVTTLPHRLEVEVAERLVEVIPSAEQVRFLRTGAEANAAAIRLARACTQREHVIASGYFGWLDWCSDAPGVPRAVRDAVSWVPFNDVAALEATVAALAHPPAAIIIEPLVHEVASVAWLETARRLAERTGAVLIFDEVKTAFRVLTGGVQALTGVTPDLTTLGKAMANGYPLAALVGRAAVMTHATKTWISSTAATESTGLAAAKAVLEWHERVDVPDRMAIAGGMMQEIIGTALTEAPWVGVRAEGPPMMWRLVGDTPEQLDALVAAAARGGVLLKRGAYQFGALAHDEAALDALAGAMPGITQALLPGPRRMEE
ncbi:MAG: aminotransferase class III-fold pyridoxal phosphate-dependent enzyme [Gemmatimonadota bacterium]|nr:aminotransferase class III-fold pyridoxal phosphate-dependent enzyme [Gemmatimonadota bacterium]MDQ8171457.1 aminotransferase class III-fold pyridoxal phosphate-dependent enzyme [Gemmatimonadota bacterium]